VYLAARAKVRPRLRMTLSYRRGSRRCVRGNLRVRVGGADGPLVNQVDFRLGTRQVARDGAAPFKTTVPRSRLRAGRAYRMRAIARLSDGRRATVVRSVRTC
jgi:hypothetical protein